MKLEISKEKAKKIYLAAPAALQEILVETFGEECFRKTDFKDFKTFDDLCRACGTTEAEFEERYKNIPIHPQAISLERIAIMTQAYNQGWEADPLDVSQYKYYPWFEVLSSGFGFSDAYCSYDVTAADVGSRLCFENKEKAEHSGKQFVKLWKEFITGKKA